MNFLHKVPCAVSAYALMLLCCLVASFLPDWRLWGVNAGAFLPGWAPWLLVVIGVGLAGLARRWPRQGTETGSKSSFGWSVGAALFVAMVCFSLFRFRTFFLGDGYTLLGLLSADTPLIKWRNYGGTILQEMLLPIVSGSPLEAATTAYQWVAWLAGGAFVGLAGAGAARLGRHHAERWLLFLGLCSGGYMLLFFGYVENYALFVVMILGYCLSGVLIFRNRLNRWLIILPQALAVFFHVFGLVLLPATILVLLKGGPVHDAWRKRSRGVRIGLILGAVLVGGSSLLIARGYSLPLEIMLLPARPDRFTIDNYVLLSWAHIADLFNLFVLLCPGAVVFFGCLRQSRRQAAKDTGETWFLSFVTLLCGAIAVFVDPKLGMARDWDLFAFAGVPLTLLVYLLVLREGSTLPSRPTAGLMIGLSLLVLIGRVAVGVSPEAGIAQTRAYMKLDPVRNHNAWSVLVDYYLAAGDSTTAARVNQEKYTVLPEEARLVSARQAFASGDLATTMADLAAVQVRYRGVGAYHSQIGATLLRMGRTDQAYSELRIALAMNPYNPNVLTNLGSIYYLRNDTALAVTHWRRALAVDPTSAMSVYGLSTVAGARQDLLQLAALFDRSANISNMPLDYYEQVIELACGQGDFALAGRAATAGLARGLDTAFLSAAGRTWPALDSLLRMP